jgi:hypothetical protein
MRMRSLISLALAALLGAAAAVLVACGSSGKGLIPEANAGPLQRDFEAIAQAAQSGDGHCTSTTEAINRTEQDFAALPATVNRTLRDRISKGIKNLRERALLLCAQPLTQTTTTGTTTTATTKTQTTTAPPTTPPPESPEATGTTPNGPTNSGGGTAAPKGEGGEGEQEEGEGENTSESGGAGLPEGTK